MAKPVSLICKDGRILSDNISVVNRILEGKKTAYYPTRSVFSLYKDGTYHVDWIYKSNQQTYAYDMPALNSSTRPPLSGSIKRFSERSKSLECRNGNWRRSCVNQGWNDS